MKGEDVDAVLELVEAFPHSLHPSPKQMERLHVLLTRKGYRLVAAVFA